MKREAAAAIAERESKVPVEEVFLLNLALGDQ
jgi:hypothetical protein